MKFTKDKIELINLFKQNNLDIEENKGNISVCASNKEITINYYETTGNIQIQKCKNEKLNSQTNGNIPSKKGVYIIHGNQKVYQLELKLILQENNLNPIISQNEPSGGLHLLDGVLRDFEKAEYAIAILANDDIVDVKNLKEKRARQNVILEIEM